MVPTTGAGNGWQNKRRSAEKVSHFFHTQMCIIFPVVIEINNIFHRLMPPQRRDMWRHIIKHVRPKEEVDLIKKSLLLHKLQKRQKPLMVRYLNYFYTF